MAQGFKPPKKAGPSKSKAKSSSSSKGPKRGAKVIAPKRKAAVAEAKTKQKQHASIMGKVEADLAGRARDGGPLTIMKKVADQAVEAAKAAKEKKK